MKRKLKRIIANAHENGTCCLSPGTFWELSAPMYAIMDREM